MYPIEQTNSPGLVPLIKVPANVDTATVIRARKLMFLVVRLSDSEVECHISMSMTGVRLEFLFVDRVSILLYQIMRVVGYFVLDKRRV